MRNIRAATIRLRRKKNENCILRTPPLHPDRRYRESSPDRRRRKNCRGLVALRQGRCPQLRACGFRRRVPGSRFPRHSHARRSWRGSHARNAVGPASPGKIPDHPRRHRILSHDRCRTARLNLRRPGPISGCDRSCIPNQRRSLAGAATGNSSRRPLSQSQAARSPSP